MKEAFEQLLKHNDKRLRFIAARYAKGHDQEDLYQEILLQLWKSKASFEGLSDMSTWVYRIGLNTGISHVRAAVKQKSFLQSIQQLFKAESTPAQDVCHSDMLMSFMKQLNDIDAAIMMMYLDGVELDEMASILGMKSNSISKRISRIKAKFEDNYIGEVA
jgi:RNA polymerase sigma-70 factor, ECF subfamily